MESEPRLHSDPAAALTPIVDESPRQKRLSLVFLAGIATVALYFSYLLARPFLTPILTAALFAIAIYPLFRKLAQRLGRRGLAALVSTIFVLLILLVPTVFIVERLAKEIAEVYGWLNEQQTLEGGWRAWGEHMIETPLAWVSARTGMSTEQLRRTALDRFQDLSASLLRWAQSLVINIGATIVDTVIMLLTLYFLLRDGERIRERIGKLLPIEPRRYEQLIGTISASISANLYGVLAVSATQGILGAIGYTIAGLPSVMLWSVATAVISMIPLAGAASVWVTATIYLIVTGSWGKAIFMAVWGAGIISTADNIVRPLVLSGKVNMHALLIFFSLLGGVRTFGIIGLFTGPIIVSVTIALLKILEEERLEWERRRG